MCPTPPLQETVRPAPLYTPTGLRNPVCTAPPLQERIALKPAFLEGGDRMKLLRNSIVVFTVIPNSIVPSLFLSMEEETVRFESSHKATICTGYFSLH